MTCTRTGDTLHISLEERIDATTAGALERELMAAADDGAGHIVLDASGLTFISSAGLRVLMRLRRQDVSLEIREVSPEVYDVFNMTGFTQILDVRRRMREVSIEGLDIIGQGANGVVYRLGDERGVPFGRALRHPLRYRAHG